MRALGTVWVLAVLALGAFAAGDVVSFRDGGAALEGTFVDG